MLIDWVTARLDLNHFDATEMEYLRSLTDRIVRFNPRTGETVWETAAWESIRSDSHQISMRVGSDALWVQGSPARVTGDGDAVFGSGASAAFDIKGCVYRMAAYAFQRIGLELRGKIKDWKVSRVDVTANLLLGSLSEVREALRILRNVEGGRYRVSQQAGDTVYWSHKSRLRAGKAYAKGPHLLYQKRRGDGIWYPEEEIDLANRLLRMELRLGSQWFREKRSGKEWYELTPDDFKSVWYDYFGKMVGGVEIKDEDDLKQRIFEVAPTEGQAKSAWGCWCQIRAEGWECAREMYANRTWYRHLKILRAAGLGDADISGGEVVPLRRKVLDLQIIHTWDELKYAA